MVTNSYPTAVVACCHGRFHVKWDSMYNPYSCNSVVKLCENYAFCRKSGCTLMLCLTMLHILTVFFTFWRGEGLCTVLVATHTHKQKNKHWVTLKYTVVIHLQ